jgi:hypothetical protein
VWCHHALDIEAAVDRNDGRSLPWTGWSPQTDRAPTKLPSPTGCSKPAATGPDRPSGPSRFSTQTVVTTRRTNSDKTDTSRRRSEGSPSIFRVSTSYHWRQAFGAAAGALLAGLVVLLSRR